MPGGSFDVDQKELELAALRQEASDPALWNDPKRATAVNRKLARYEQIIDNRHVSRSLHQALDDVFLGVREARPVACRLDDAEIGGFEWRHHVGSPGTLRRDAGHWPVVWPLWLAYLPFKAHDLHAVFAQ